MTNHSSTVNSFLNQERLRQAAALAGPNTDPVAVIHCSSMFGWSDILDKLRDDKAIGDAEVWVHGRYMTYHGQSRAIWNLSSQTPSPSVADSLAGIAKRTDKEAHASVMRGLEQAQRGEFADPPDLDEGERLAAMIPDESDELTAKDGFLAVVNELAVTTRQSKAEVLRNAVNCYHKYVWDLIEQEVQAEIDAHRKEKRNTPPSD